MTRRYLLDSAILRMSTSDVISELFKDARLAWPSVDLYDQKDLGIIDLLD